MPTLWWKSLRDFERDLKAADLAHLNLMRDWAREREQSADRSGMGRSAKARRLFRQMRQAAEQELTRREARRK